MDNRIRWELNKIGANIPKELLAKGLRKKRDKDGEEMRTQAEYAAKNDPKVAELLKAGAFDPTETTVVDEKGAKEIENWIGTKVEQLIRDGKIPPAEKDNFIRELESKMKK